MGRVFYRACRPGHLKEGGKGRVVETAALIGQTTQIL